ncbi:MAG TPA: urate hydroxylase PuuD [Myxococcota bacterium]|nr:urate hydroxylase PuuD [Myxococcota bacterium]
MAIFSLDGFLILLRWIHFMAGITWIGMLYYLNFAQTPFLATELGGTARSPMLRGLVPSVLWWFRWGAMITFLTGWTIVITKMVVGGSSSVYYATILTGGFLGTFMWFNVWFVIMPRQYKIMANAENVAAGKPADPAAAAVAPVAGRASRTNTLFSIPMLFFMGAASHFPQLASRMEPMVVPYLVGVLVIAAICEANIFTGTVPKPLSTVSGTIHSGLGLTLVLYVLAAALL